MRRMILTVAAAASFWSPGQAAARWHEVETDNFVIAGDASAGTIERFAVELERYRAFIAALTVGQAEAEPVRVPVYLMASDGSFEAIFAGRNAAGVYTQRIGSPVFVGNAERDRSRDMVRGQSRDTGRRARTVIKHEYVHHFTYVNGPTYFPMWYSEGFAEYLSTATYEDGAMRLGAVPNMRAQSLTYGRKLPWVQVFASSLGWANNGKRLSSDDVAMLYAQSWVATHYLRHSPEFAPKVAGYLTAIRAEPKRPLETFEAAFGISAEAMGEHLEDYVARNEFSVLAVPMPDVHMERPDAARLSRWEGRLAEAEARRFFARDDEKREALAADLRDLLADEPQSAAALTELAWVLLDLKQRPAAEPILARLEAVAPDAGQTHLLRGLVRLGPEARGHYAAARAADPKDARAHYEFAKTYTGGAAVTDEALDGAVTALRLSADRNDVPLVAAHLLIERGYHEDARYLLEPLAAWSRDEGVRAQAERLLARAGG